VLRTHDQTFRLSIEFRAVVQVQALQKIELLAWRFGFPNVVGRFVWFSNRACAWRGATFKSFLIATSWCLFGNSKPSS